MLFSSILFLFYFLPVTLIVHTLLGFSLKAQNFWLLLVSLVFYAWGEPLFVLVMIASILVNTILGIIVDRVRGNRLQSRLTLAFTVLLNTGLLFVFKYLGFVVRNINAVVATFSDWQINFEGFALPLGISFFTFQAMSYVFDVYRQDAKVEKNPFYVGLYVAFFPQLVAGPIVRYADVAKMIRSRHITWAGFSSGVCRFITGVGKKILIANAMANIADRIFDLSAVGHASYNVPVTLAWVGIIAYTLQIYYDFSGYSDMAIGLGRMFGFEFKENFNYPYISDSIVEFWRRWHISLSTWFREYVYFPLGGSRVENNDKMVRNTLIVWLLTGIWHGAEWTFVLWGLWNVAFILLERVVNFSALRIPKAAKHVYAMLVVGIGWTLFRANNVYQAAQYLLNAMGMNNNGFFSDTALMFVREYWLFFLAGIIFATPIAQKTGQWMKDGMLGKWERVYGIIYPVAYGALYIICITYLAKGSYNPFIYFNF